MQPLLYKPPPPRLDTNNGMNPITIHSISTMKPDMTRIEPSIREHQSTTPHRLDPDIRGNPDRQPQSLPKRQPPETKPNRPRQSPHQLHQPPKLSHLIKKIYNNNKTTPQKEQCEGGSQNKKSIPRKLRPPIAGKHWPPALSIPDNRHQNQGRKHHTSQSQPRIMNPCYLIRNPGQRIQDKQMRPKYKQRTLPVKQKPPKNPQILYKTTYCQQSYISSQICHTHKNPEVPVSPIRFQKTN